LAVSDTTGSAIPPVVSLVLTIITSDIEA